MNRRELIAALAAGAVAAPAWGATADITVGITADTRPDWNGPENFLRAIRECSDLGYHWIETFWPYVARWGDDPAELIDVLAALGLKMETVSNGGGQNTAFQDPTQRADVIESHMKLVRFIKALGCDHLKINCGARNPGGNTDEIYREQAKTFDELGKRISDEGIKFGVHAHLFSQFETPRDVGRIMEMTDPKHVYFVLDTGHITMAGMDSLALTKRLGHRIIEFHLKDVDPKDKGGYKGPPLIQQNINTRPDNRTFFELGKGGVDFKGIQAHLNSIAWKGWFSVELDRTATTSKDSAATSKHYLENVLGLKT
jgi:sugar phosphate isomerase/epimerase